MTAVSYPAPRRWARDRQPITARRIAGALLAAAVVVMAWLTLAPVAIGGPASYVVTDGISMLPKFHADGLVLTRSEPAYHVGEVVAYHNLQLQTVVMHRIVAIDGDRYVFKGDNNDFRDSYHPTRSQIVGKEWVYIPNAGKVFSFLRRPLTFALIMGILGIFAAQAYAPRRNRRRRRHHTSH